MWLFNFGQVLGVRSCFMAGIYDSRLTRLECRVVLMDNGEIADNVLVSDALLPEFHLN